MHIVITGGAGFIGSHLAEYHLQKGDTVHVIDTLITGNIKNIEPFFQNPRFSFDKANIMNCNSLKPHCEKADRIYHMAAIVGVYEVIEKTLDVLFTNIHGTETLLKTVKEVRNKPHIFIASTSSVYGHSKKDSLSETDELRIHSITHPLTSYALSKMTNEVMGLAYYQNDGIPITILRLFNTIGRRQRGTYGMVVPRFIEKALHNQPINVFGDGTQTRSFCDVRDIVMFLNSLAENSECIGEIINVGNNQEISINALAHLIKEILHSKSEIIHTPYDEAYGKKFVDIMRRKPDLSKLQRLTTYKHQWTLEQTIADLKNYYNKNN
jgi:UDP-glucose 4-epimerase